jgi:hypothetical protein
MTFGASSVKTWCQSPLTFNRLFMVNVNTPMEMLKAFAICFLAGMAVMRALVAVADDKGEAVSASRN